MYTIIIVYSVFQVACPEEIKNLFVQGTTAVFISSGFHSAVVSCTNKDNSHFLSLLDKQPEIHCSKAFKIDQTPDSRNLYCAFQNSCPGSKWHRQWALA